MTVVESAAVAVLVNGLPGAGKTTLSTELSRVLGLPLFSKDVIKEVHADILGSHAIGYSQRQWNSAVGAAASQTMWALLAHAPAGAVLESSWRADVRDLVLQGLSTARHALPVEVWCEVPMETARHRCAARLPRHPIHGELPGDAEWESWRELARPLAVGPLLRVDTSVPVDMSAVAAWIGAQAHAGPAGQANAAPSPRP
ncbi:MULTISPECIES: AAA family ATPase [Streptacidiphilus]|uniref:AAA family ATPase n=1 Tax=Streptacidiphilus cavernicola TaxID=3342716 RepID=A0ABV6UPM4_9ACTN|nr:AAA family ATPase [Streptacidiphilus jeojiense]